MSTKLTKEVLRHIGLEAGLTKVGFTHAKPFEEALVELTTRKEAGLHAGMQFTYRNPERSTTPTRILETAQSLIVGAWPYAAPQDAARPSSQPPARPQAEIASYAWRDHYAALKDALGQMAAELTDAGHTARIVADDNALVDRAAAIRAGIGWSGKNSNVLVPGHGSWFVLGAIVTDAQFEPDVAVEPACGSCRRCFDGCPTDAIIADGVVDARRCLAWLLQADGDFPLEFRKALGTRIYGCDDCQVVCPPSRGTAVAQYGDEVSHLDLLSLLTDDDETLLANVGRWYIPKRDLRYVRRNALVALGNAELSPEIRDEAAQVTASYFSSKGGSGDPMLDRHARWAAEQQGF